MGCKRFRMRVLARLIKTEWDGYGGVTQTVRPVGTSTHPTIRCRVGSRTHQFYRQILGEANYSRVSRAALKNSSSTGVQSSKSVPPAR